MEPIRFAVKAVKETEYFVDESMNPGDNFDFRLNASLNIVTQMDEVHFTVNYNYRLKGTDNDFMRGKTTTLFIVEGLAKKAKVQEGKEMVDLPNEVWISLLSISYSHARAMFARSSAGTRFGHLILPLVNPQEQFNQIFGSELAKNASLSSASVAK
jgi:hypothetical protein